MSDSTYPAYVPDVFKVRMTQDLMEALVRMVAQVEGATVSLDWGTPDVDGFYNPTLTVTYYPVKHKRYGDQP